MAETEMVERVARKLWAVRVRRMLQRDGIVLEEWGDGSVPRQNGVYEEAKAAIEEMREPTSSMCDAGVIGTKADVSFFDVAETYSAMIDAALSPPSKD